MSPQRVKLVLPDGRHATVETFTAREIADRLWQGDQRGAVVAASRLAEAFWHSGDVRVEFEERELSALLHAAAELEWAVPQPEVWQLASPEPAA